METRLEGILQRAISARRYYPQSREYALSLLLGWEGTRTCRLAVEAVVSCAIRVGSILHGRALEWVGRERENPLVHACLLDISKRSAARRSEVLHLMDGCGIELSPPARSIWRKTREVTPSWSNIAKTCGARWENFPAEGTLLEACLVVMEDNPEEDLPVILEDVLSHHLGDMPGVRKEIIKLTVERPELASVVARHAGALPEELAKFLVSAREPENLSLVRDDYRGAYEDALWAVSHALASFLAQCKELSPAQRRAVNLLLNAKRPCRPWVAACGALLTPLASSPEEKISFLARAWRRRSPFVPEALDASLELEAFVYRLLPEERQVFVQKILGLENVTSLWEALGPWMFGQIAKDATVYADILSGVLEHVTPGVMLEYLDCTTGRPNVGLVQRWVDDLSSDIHLGRGQEALRLLEVLSGMGCPMRAFLPCHARELLEAAGYQLRPDDIGDPKVISLILEKGRERIVWENKQWRDVLLRHSPTAVVVSSFISYAETRSGDKIAWAADILFPLCDETPELWKTLMEVAWGKTLASFAQFLVLRRGMSAEETTLARAVILKNPWLWLRVEHLKRGVFEKLFSPAEEIDIFLAHVGKEYLPQAELFETLFSGEDARKRLLEALRTCYDQGNGNSAMWAEWVARYRFVDDKRVRDHLAHIILSPSAHKYEVDAALAALGL